MKATIEIPDELYRRVKSRSALLGRSVRDVTTELYRQWLGDQTSSDTPVVRGSWIDQWVTLGGRLQPEESEDVPTAREILSNDRNRLEAEDARG